MPAGDGPRRERRKRGRWKGRRRKWPRRKRRRTRRGQRRTRWGVRKGRIVAPDCVDLEENLWRCISKDFIGCLTWAGTTCFMTCGELGTADCVFSAECDVPSLDCTCTGGARTGETFNLTACAPELAGQYCCVPEP